MLISRLRLAGAAWMSLLCCVVPPVPLPHPSGATLPEAILGEWNTSLADCGVSFSEGRLVVEPHRLILYANRAEILSIAEEQTDRWRLTLLFPQEGEEPGAAEPTPVERRYALSADRRQLEDISEGEPGLVRWRCPSGQRQGAT